MPYLPGRNPLKEILLAKPENIKQVFTSLKNPDKKCRELLDKVAKQGISVINKDSAELDQLSEKVVHQGIVTEIKERNIFLLKDFLKQKKNSKKLLVLDNILDPQNFGSILRAAECFGVDGVIFCANRSSGITATVAKASVGASELVNLIQVSNLANAIDELKKHEFWVIAAATGKKAESISDFNFPKKTALILGAEGAGVQPLLLKKSDFQVYIPMLGQIDSLNVSQAAAVFLASQIS